MTRKLSSSEASVLNFAVFQTASRFGPHRQDGRAMCTILDLQSCLHLSPPGNLICGYPVSASTTCRMRHFFVNILDVLEGFWKTDILTRPAVRRCPGNHFSIEQRCPEMRRRCSLMRVRRPASATSPLSQPALQPPKHDGPLRSASPGKPPGLDWTPKRSGEPHSGSRRHASCVRTGEPAFPQEYPIV